MGRSMIMKRKGRKLVPAIHSLPGELVTEILARIASSSFTDFFNAKLSCREFTEASDDKYVIQRVSILNIPPVPWRISEEALSFLKRCEENENPEALYRQGMVAYFSSMRVEQGLEYLKKAADLGHMEATYVLGIILASKGDHSRLHGLKRLNIQECRKRSKGIIRQMWINNFLDRQEHICCTACIKNREIQVHRWPSMDDEEIPGCEDCKWKCEINIFCNMLYGV